MNEVGEKTYVLTGVNQEGQEMFEVTAVNPFGEIKKQEGIVADRNERDGWFDDLYYNYLLLVNLLYLVIK